MDVVAEAPIEIIPHNERTEELIGVLHRLLVQSFPVRQIAILVERGGRLVLVGHPTGDEITRAAMLLASVHMRLPRDHGYVTASIPGAARLRLLMRTERGSILVAPVFDGDVAIGAILVEGEAGHIFDDDDLLRLEAIVTTGVTALM